MTIRQFPKIYLPDLPSDFSFWLLVTGGRPPEISWLRTLLGSNMISDCWAADHGMDVLYQAKIPFSHLLGDGDSASKEALAWAETQKVSIEKFPRAKDYTDTQLALKRMQEAGAPAILLTGGFGGRFDHAYSTLFSCAQLDIPCILMDEQEALFYAKPNQNLRLAFSSRPKSISLLPFTEAVKGVSTQNLRWELTDAALTQAQPYAVSNELLPEKEICQISLQEGILGIHCYWGKY